MGTNHLGNQYGSRRTKGDETKMILDTGTLVAMLIGLLSSITLIFIFANKQMKLEKEIRRLQLELRKKRTN